MVWKIRSFSSIPQGIQSVGIFISKIDFADLEPRTMSISKMKGNFFFKNNEIV